jgi:hypothetical protein
MLLTVFPFAEDFHPTDTAAALLLRSCRDGEGGLMLGCRRGIGDHRPNPHHHSFRFRSEPLGNHLSHLRARD